MSSLNEQIKTQPAPPVPCAPGIKPKPPTKDNYNKTNVTESKKKNEILSYDFHIENIKILNEQNIGTINSDKIQDLLENLIKEII